MTPDPTKTATPRTDEAFRKRPLNDFCGKPVVPADFARQLERENQSLRNEVERLQNYATNLQDDTMDLRTKLTSLRKAAEAARVALEAATKLLRESEWMSHLYCADDCDEALAALRAELSPDR